MKLLSKVLTFIALISITSCSTLLSDNLYSVNITNTDKVNFVVKDNNNKTVIKGTTPQTVFLSSKVGYFKRPIYKIYKEGCNNPYVLRFKIDQWYWCNTWTGAIGFLIIDPLSGSMYSTDIKNIEL